MNTTKFLFFAKSKNTFFQIIKKMNNKFLFIAKASVIVITALVFVSCGDGSADASGSTTSAKTPDLNVTFNATNDSGTINFFATIMNNSNATVDLSLIGLHRIEITTSGKEVIIATSDQNRRLLPNQSFSFATTDIPAEHGNYNYKFCVQDTSSNNFCSNERSFALFPELSISLSINTEIVNAHTNFYLTTAVTNSGNKLSPSTSIDIFRSLSNTFDSSSSSIWMANIGNLSKDASVSRIATWQESNVENYFYRACVRTVLGERNIDNNCTDAVEIEVEALSLNVVLNSTNDSGIIEVAATITNSSSINVNIALIEFYRNEGFLVTSDNHNRRLLSNQSFNFTTTDIPAEPGNYTYKVCMRDASSNNFCSNERSFALFPELSISLRSSAGVVNPSSDFMLTAEVANSGKRFSPATQIDIFRSLSNTFDTSSNILTRNIGDLSTDESFSAMINQRENIVRSYFYRACVRTVFGEKNTNNNCSERIEVEVFAIADLSIDTIGVSSTNVEAGSPLTISAKISNIGLADASAITIQFYRSRDNMISTADVLLTSASIDALSRGASIDVGVTAIGKLGRFYYGACVLDRINVSEDVSNNCSYGISINTNLLWQQATASASWSGRSGHTSLIYNNKMWILGGFDGTNNFNDIWDSTDGINWQQATGSAGWSARSGHTSLVYDDKMWVIGGWNGSHNLNDIWDSTDGINWKQATRSAGWSIRNGHTSLVYDDKMWVLGGT